MPNTKTNETTSLGCTTRLLWNKQQVLYLKLDRPRDPRNPPRPPPDILLKCDASSTWTILPWKSCHSHTTLIITNTLLIQQLLMTICHNHLYHDTTNTTSDFLLIMHLPEVIQVSQCRPNMNYWQLSKQNSHMLEAQSSMSKHTLKFIHIN